MTQNKRPYIIGLTGNSGSGKGAAGEILAELGCLVIDCDKVAHENMAKVGIAYDDIVNAFGKEILSENGGIDRKILGGIVFSDKKKLEKLNQIAHKYVKKRVEEIISENKNYDFIVVDAPVLKEAGMTDTVDCIWLVTADENTRLKRVTKRDNITEEAARARFKNQTPFDENEADAVIYNNSDDKEALRREVEECFASAAANFCIGSKL
ncbi:MAG: dephospho-CoA kinase [Firmicutes bacterium]|nr:dephospho-CoA kinase [Bacillota bacterium]